MTYTIVQINKATGEEEELDTFEDRLRMLQTLDYYESTTVIYEYRVKEGAI